MKKTYKDGCYEADFSCGNSARGVCTKSGKEVFIKRWYPQNARGNNEISVTGMIKNEYVLNYYDTFTDNGILYAVRDWIDGVSLAEWVLSEETTDMTKVLDIMIKICMALRSIQDKHGPFIHADIRPANIIYDRISKRIWLIDFETFTFVKDSDKHGISGLLQKGGYTVSLSTEGFSAPEIYTGAICIQSDIFSLGKLFAFMLGISGPDGVIHHSAERKIDKNAMSIIQKCTQSAASKRYVDIGELLDELCGLFNETASTGDKVIPFSTRLKKEKTVYCSGSKKVVYVAGNSCFASEFAYASASMAGIKTVLLENNSSIGIGAFDYFIGKKNNTVSYVSEDSNPFFCDCRHLYLTDEKQWTIRGILSNCSHNENLYMSECNIFSEFDISQESELKKLLEWTGKYFGLTVICDSTDNRDDVSAIMMKAADYIIVPVRPDIDEVYATYKQYKQYCAKYGCSYEQLIFIAWEYEDDISMPINDFKIAVDNLYGGSIPYDAERQKCKNVRGDFYCVQYEKEIYVFYSELIKRILRM